MRLHLILIILLFAFVNEKFFTQTIILPGTTYEIFLGIENAPTGNNQEYTFELTSISIIYEVEFPSMTYGPFTIDNDGTYNKCEYIVSDNLPIRNWKGWDAVFSQNSDVDIFANALYVLTIKSNSSNLSAYI